MGTEHGARSKAGWQPVWGLVGSWFGGWLAAGLGAGWQLVGELAAHWYGGPLGVGKARFADPPGEAKLCKGCSNRGLGGVTRRIRSGPRRMGWGSPKNLVLSFNFQSTEHRVRSKVSTEHGAQHEP